MKRISFVSLAIIIILFTGCVSVRNVSPSSTIIPSPSLTLKPNFLPTSATTFTPIFTPTLTSTPQPPLTNHKWNAEPILISMRETIGDGGTSIGDVGTTWFILYNDGSLILNHWIVENDNYHLQYLTKKLTQTEICQHLNTLDQIGFLDYDASDYTFIGGDPYGIGGGSIKIKINTWKSKDDSFYDLGFYLQKDIIDELYGQKGYPIISPALRDAYYFLSQYPETELEVYRPERLAVWIEPAGYLHSDYKELAQIWQLGEPSLQKLLQNSTTYIDGTDEKYIELRGDEAKAVYSYFGSMNDNRVFKEILSDGEEQYFVLLVRPLLPFEKLNEDHMSDITPLNSEKTNFTLSCLASNGVLPIPTLTNP